MAGREPPAPPPPPLEPSLCPATVPLTASASFNGTCNRQQPPPTASATASNRLSNRFWGASGAPSLLMHPCPPPPPWYTSAAMFDSSKLKYTNTRSGLVLMSDDGQSALEWKCCEMGKVDVREDDNNTTWAEVLSKRKKFRGSWGHWVHGGVGCPVQVRTPPPALLGLQRGPNYFSGFGGIFQFPVFILSILSIK